MDMCGIGVSFISRS